MTSVDELFKKPNIPSKRKLEVPIHDPSTFYKSTKRDANGTPARTNGRAAQVEDDGLERDEDELAGPSLPPEDGDEDEDEEGGRFFGGGIGGETKEVLDFVDRQDDDADAAPEVIDTSWLRKTALNFERHISKNSELRAKFEDQPEKFMSSEADLDADIKALSILSEHPDLYSEFAKLGCARSLILLLAHENTDIAIDAIEIIAELTDEDVQAEDNQWLSLVDASLEADLLSLLVSNLQRFDETLDSDRNGVYHTFSILENLSSHPPIASQIGSTPSILSYLHSRIQKPETPSVSQNKQYAAEILAILLQSSPTTATPTFLNLSPSSSSESPSPPLDNLLQLLSRYRRRDPPPSTDEEEFVENLFDALTCLVDSSLGKSQFLVAEGIELCVILLKESKFAKSRAVRVLDHALSGSGRGSASASASGSKAAAADDSSSTAATALLSACTSRLVIEAQGLGVIFKAFMKATSPSSTQKPEKDSALSPAFLEHLLGIFASLLRYLPAASAPRIRTLAKFVEKDYEKLERLVKLRAELAAKLAAVERGIKAERKAMQQQDKDLDEEERGLRESEFLSRRFDAGLFSLQTVDLVLAWCGAEDEGARGRVEELLAEHGPGQGRGGGMEVVKGTLRELLGGVGGAEEGGDADADAATREMLETLLRCL